MLKQYRYPMKPHRIKIYYEEEIGDNYIKQYIIPKDKYIKAYARQLSANEQASANAVQDSSFYEFVINKRDVKIDMFIEFDRGYGEQTFEISGTDFMEFFKGEITIRAVEVTPKEHSEVRWLDDNVS